MKVENHEKLREELEEYYKEAELWLPQDESRRVYKVKKLDSNGEVHFTLLRDRITSKSKLRRHLVNLTPLDVYFSVSCFLNPTKTREKTWKKENDGRRHRDKNGFLYSDIVIDMDHLDREEVANLYDFLTSYYPEDQVYIVFSGGGWHINIKKWYRNKKIPDPIKREEDFEEAAQRFTEWLDELGFKFDFQKQKDEETGEEKYNSPTTDTRRVRKLPGTVTSHGNRSEMVDRSNLHSFEPETVLSRVNTFNTEHNFKDYQEEVNNGGNTDSRVLLENTKSET